MSAVCLQRPLLHHLHLPSHLQLAVSPFCRPTRSLGAKASGTKPKFQSRYLLCNRSVTNLRGIGDRSEGGLFRRGQLYLPWVYRCDGRGPKVARRSLKKLTPVVEEQAIMEEKPTGRKRPSSQPKQLNLRTSGAHGNTFISFVQILGTGMDTGDTSPSVLLFFDKRRIIFNAGEGLQRFCIEHKIKLSKLDHVFLTRVCSETASGLPGLLLTLSNTGDSGMSVNLWGPSELDFLVDAMRTFIPYSSVVHTHSFGEKSQESTSSSPSTKDQGITAGDAIMLLDDEVVKVSAVLLRPSAAEPTKSSLRGLRKSEAPNATVNEGASERKNFRGSGTKLLDAKIEGGSFLFAEPWQLGFEDEINTEPPGSLKRPRVEPPLAFTAQVIGGDFTSEALTMVGKEFPNLGHGDSESREVAVVYICELPEIIGKFDPEKAKAKGLRPGPKYGQLQAGKSVVTDDGKEPVHPSDVMGPSSPGPICLVLDCPTISHISALITAPSLKKLSPKGGGLKKVTCIIHLGPAAVLECSEYLEWMAEFEGTEHLMAGHGMLNNVAPILKASARVMTRLNFICPQVFPNAGLPQTDAMDTCQENLRGRASVTMAENLLKFWLRPISATPFDRSLVPEPLDISAVRRELLDENPDLQQASERIAELWNVKPRLSVGPELSRNLYNREPRLAAEGSMEWVDNSPNSAREGVSSEPRVLSPGGVVAGLVEELPDCLKGVGREDMEMVFLGTGSSQPSKYRNVSAIYVHLFKRGGVLLDCGEGTYAQLKRRYGNKAADEIVAGIKCVWISHIHADHHTGLARILSVRKNILESRGKLEPVLVVGPKQLKKYLDAYGRLEDLAMEFLDCSQTTSDAERAARLVRDGPDSVRGGDFHTLGYLDTLEGAEGSAAIAKAPVGLIRPVSTVKMLNGDGRPVSGQLRNYWLQSGFNFQAGLDEQGLEKLKTTLSALGLSHLRSVPVVHCPHAFGVVLVARGKKLLQSGWKLVYSGDTRPCQTLVEASKGATVLIHEATFDDGMPEEALAKSHSLTREAIETGVSAGAYRTILTHFSQRYPKIPVFDESYNDRTCIAFDMMSANLADLPFLPKLLPALKILFKDDMMLVDEGGEDLKE